MPGFLYRSSKYTCTSQEEVNWPGEWQHHIHFFFEPMENMGVIAGCHVTVVFTTLEVKSILTGPLNLPETFRPMNIHCLQTGKPPVIPTLFFPALPNKLIWYCDGSRTCGRRGKLRGRWHWSNRRYIRNITGYWRWNQPRMGPRKSWKEASGYLANFGFISFSFLSWSSHDVSEIASTGPHLTQQTKISQVLTGEQKLSWQVSLVRGGSIQTSGRNLRHLFTLHINPIILFARHKKLDK